ncbi:methyltransferase domain-containing protein [Pseudonocardia endophytica]|uniref:Protein-L-isoaspartate O-methyltransferase n=1 Tax=Pseudonocardia endophytica TaxID=401976 RepID=A0A4R1HFX4_PSEEN|nr:methyltransferase domain-containing protein [Pseudonocardia endophytica]TCK21054.1 protein-L-isoaspartate(D-aspartate) O-methyltransferase [Pseudonocardia endophytica]
MPDAVARARAHLVTELMREGRVRSDPVAEALSTVPRHLFLPDLEPEDAYADEAVPIKIADGVTLSSVSQPSMVGIMLEQLGVEPGDRILEIGAGAGWNAALLARITGPTGTVTTVDIDDDLVARTRENLAAAGVSGVDALVADGAVGHPPGAPYDRIELTVGATDIRPEWVDQLTSDGRLLLPLAVRGSQLSIAFARTGPRRLESVSVRGCAFVRLRGVGAGDSGTVALGTPGWSVQLSEANSCVDDALTGPVTAEIPSGCPASAADVWDGLGLWCAIADPAVFRLLAEGPAAESTLGRSLLGSSAGRFAVGLACDDGVALLVSDPERTIHGFGDGGARAATRLAALVDGWIAAGHPQAADLRIEADVGPGSTGDTLSEATTGPGLDTVVHTQSARLRIRTP